MTMLNENWLNVKIESSDKRVTSRREKHVRKTI